MQQLFSHFIHGFYELTDAQVGPWLNNLEYVENYSTSGISQILPV